MLFMAVVAFILVGQLKYTFVIEYSVEVLNVTGSSFHYNLWGSLNKLWEEELYFLYMFLFIFSGLWPFVKLVMLTAIVLFPFTRQRRLLYLDWIAAVGVWSFADIWVVVMISIILNAEKSIMIDADTSVTAVLQVTPLEGCVILFFGLLFSQLINIAAIWWCHSASSSVASTSRGQYSRLPSSGLSALIPGDEYDHDQSDSDSDSDNDGGDGEHSDGCGSDDDDVAPTWPPVAHPLCRHSVGALYSALLLYVSAALFWAPLFEIKYVVMKKYETESRYSVFSGLMHMHRTAGGSSGGGGGGGGGVEQQLLFWVALLFVVVSPLVYHVAVWVMWLLALPGTPLSKSSATSSGHGLPPLLSRSTRRGVGHALATLSHFCSLDVFLLSSLFVSHELGSLLAKLALGRYLRIQITVLPQFYVFCGCVLVLSQVTSRVRGAVCGPGQLLAGEAESSSAAGSRTAARPEPARGGAALMMAGSARTHSIVL